MSTALGLHLINTVRLGHPGHGQALSHSHAAEIFVGVALVAAAFLLFRTNKRRRHAHTRHTDT